MSAGWVSPEASLLGLQITVSCCVLMWLFLVWVPILDGPAPRIRTQVMLDEGPLM